MAKVWVTKIRIVAVAVHALDVCKGHSSGAAEVFIVVKDFCANAFAIGMIWANNELTLDLCR